MESYDTELNTTTAIQSQAGMVNTSADSTEVHMDSQSEPRIVPGQSESRIPDQSGGATIDDDDDDVPEDAEEQWVQVQNSRIEFTLFSA